MTDKIRVPKALEGSVGFLLSKLSQRLVQTAADRLPNLKIQARHVGVMTVVSEWGPSSQKTIGDTLQIDRTTMVGLVDELESLGLVTRSPDPADRRAALVNLTSDGGRVLRTAWTIIESLEANFLRPLSAKQRAQFLVMVKTLFHGEK